MLMSKTALIKDIRSVADDLQHFQNRTFIEDDELRNELASRQLEFKWLEEAYFK